MIAALPSPKAASLRVAPTCASIRPGSLQRKCACGGTPGSSGECEECRRKKLQRKSIAPQAAAQNAVAPPIVHEVLRSPGQPLDPATRAFMEPRFGHDFSHVRVHTDATAAESALAVNARAFTVGRDVVFGKEQFSPTAIGGRMLIAHELAHVIQQGQSGAGETSGEVKVSHEQGAEREAAFAAQHIAGDLRQPTIKERVPQVEIQRDTPAKPTHEDVWGFQVDGSMCGCRARIRSDINWANHAASSYAACDIPANSTGPDVDACFDAANPGATVVATTSSSGTVTLPPPSADPCERISSKSDLVHETGHSRHADAMARLQGTAFFSDWNHLAGDPNRLDKLRAKYPTEVAAYEAQWQNGHDWARDEVHSYTFERRFLSDALDALNRICP